MIDVAKLRALHAETTARPISEAYVARTADCTDADPCYTLPTGGLTQEGDRFVDPWTIKLSPCKVGIKISAYRMVLRPRPMPPDCRICGKPIVCEASVCRVHAEAAAILAGKEGAK